MAGELFKLGLKSTLQLKQGVNLSYQGGGEAIYTHTELDRWSLGDFVSAEYIINAEYGLNERETIHATLVAMPGNTSITIYGRTTLTRQLLNIRSDASNSYASLIVEPASSDVQGCIVTFFANYAKASMPLVPMNSAATATGCSWSSTGSPVTDLTITVPTNKLTGFIAVNQYVKGSNIPFPAFVKSYNKNTGSLVITGFKSQSFSAQTNQTLTFTASELSLSNTVNTIQSSNQFSSVIVPGQSTITATNKSDFLSFIPGSGIGLTTNSSTKQVTLTNKGIRTVAVSGQAVIDPTISNINVLNVASGTGISLTTNNQTNTLTVASTGITLIADDANNIAGTSLAVGGGTGISSTVVNNRLVLNNTAAAYSRVTDGVSTSIASSLTSSLLFSSGNGVTVTVGTNQITVTNTGVLSLGGNTGAISTASLMTIINGSGSSINLPVGSVTPSAGAFTDITANSIIAASAGFSSDISASGSVVAGKGGRFKYLARGVNLVNSPANGLMNADVINGDIVYYTANATADSQLNLRGNSTTAFDALLDINNYIDVVFLTTNGSSAYKLSQVQIDGVAQTIKWQNGSAPSGNANSIDSYTIRVVKVGAATYQVFANLIRFA